MLWVCVSDFRRVKIKKDEGVYQIKSAVTHSPRRLIHSWRNCVLTKVSVPLGPTAV